MMRSRPRFPRPPRSSPEAAGGFFQNLIDVYFSPREAFTRIVRSPRILLPLVGYVVLVLGFTGIWMQKMDARRVHEDPDRGVRSGRQDPGRAA